MSYKIVVDVRPGTSTPSESHEKVTTTVFTGSHQECTDRLPGIQAGWPLSYSDESVTIKQVV
jgi:hypothetical protein